MTERLSNDIRLVGVLIGSDGRSAIAFKEHSSGLISTVPQEGMPRGIGQLPEVKRTARRLAREHDTTVVIPKQIR